MSVRPPIHHLPDDVLLEYAAGNCNPAISLFVASHLELCGTCRTALQGFEAVGASFLQDSHAPFDPRGLTEVMARLDDDESGDATTAADVGNEPLPPWVPDALVPTVRRVGGLRWRFVVPGIRTIDLPTNSPRFRARLVRQAPGLTVPRHGHEGEEYVLVLAGGLRDTDLHLRRGDAVVRAAEFQHRIVIDRDEPCYALQVNEGGLRPTTVLGRILKLIARE